MAYAVHIHRTMKLLAKIATISLSALVGTCAAPVFVARWEAAFREADRRAAGERELARIIGETPADRRDAEIVASLVGR